MFSLLGNDQRAERHRPEIAVGHRLATTSTVATYLDTTLESPRYGGGLGAGGPRTSSYQEMAESDSFLWGSTPGKPIRLFSIISERYPRGAQLVVVDPRRTSSAAIRGHLARPRCRFRIALASAMDREIIHSGLVNENYSSMPPADSASIPRERRKYTLERAGKRNRVPAGGFAKPPMPSKSPSRPGWLTLGITETPQRGDNVLALSIWTFSPRTRRLIRQRHQSASRPD